MCAPRPWIRGAHELLGEEVDCDVRVGDEVGQMLTFGKDAPSPNTYRIKGNFDKLRLQNGKTFGISH